MLLRSLPIHVVCLTALLSLSCQHNRIPASSVKPTIPPFVSEKPSFDRLEAPALAPTEVRLPLVVRTDLTPLQRSISEAIPDRIPDSTTLRMKQGLQPEETSAWVFTRQGDPQIRIQDGLVVIHGVYQAEPRLSSIPEACRVHPYQVTIDSTGQIQVTQQDDKVFVQHHPTQVNIGHRKIPEGVICDAGGTTLEEMAARWFETQTWKQQLARSSEMDTVRMPVGEIWKDLSMPISVPVTTMNSRICLYGQPTEIVFGRPQGTMEQTLFHAIVRQSPVASYEPACSAVSYKPMMARGSSISTSPATADSPYKILASVSIPYTVLNQSFQNRLFHQSMRLEGGDPVIIEKVTASDARGRVLLSIEVTGGLNGTVYYWGVPQLQQNGRLLAIPDLQMADESKRALDTFKLGHWQVIDQHLRSQLREAATIDLATYVDTMKAALTGQHKAGDVNLDLLVAEQRPQHARTSENALLVYYLMEGTASATSHLSLDRITRRENTSGQTHGETAEAPLH